MTVFKVYCKIMRRSGIGLTVYVLIFTVIAIGIFLSEKSGEEVKPARNLKIAVINLDDREESLGLLEFLKQNFKVLEWEDDEVILKESLFTQDIEYALKIEKGGELTSYAYSNTVVNVLVNERIREYLSLNRLLYAYRIKEKPEKIAGEIMSRDLLLSFNTGKEGRNISYNFKGYFTALSYVLSAVLMMGVYIGKDAFYKRKVKNRIGISKESMKSFNLKLFASSGTFVLVTWLYFVLLCVTLFGLEHLSNGMIYMYIFGSFIFMIPTIALSYLVALFSKNYEMSSALVNMITLPSAFISGVFVPREVLPEFVEKIAIFSPMYWATRVYENIADGNFFVPETGFFLLIEILMGGMFLSIALVLTKNRGLKEA